MWGTFLLFLWHQIIVLNVIFILFPVSDEEILQTVGKHVIGLYLLGWSGSDFFTARLVFPRVNHSGANSGSLIN